MYHEITVWTRGIIMDKEARDVANSLAQAARLDGRRAIHISDYVDSPDRTNCLVRKDARISDTEIDDRRSTEGAAELAAVGGGISAPLLGATARATGCVSLESLEAVVADPEGARRGYEECRILDAEQLAEAVQAVRATR